MTRDRERERDEDKRRRQKHGSESTPSRVELERDISDRGEYACDRQPDAVRELVLWKSREGTSSLEVVLEMRGVFVLVESV